MHMTISKDLAYRLLKSEGTADPTEKFNPSKSYSKLEIVQYRGYIYTSVSDYNKGNYPQIETSTWWVKGAKVSTDKWKDGACGSKTISDEVMTFEFDGTDIGKISICGLAGSELKVEGVGGSAFTETITLTAEETEMDCWIWFHPEAPTTPVDTTYTKTLDATLGGSGAVDKIIITVTPKKDGFGEIGSIVLGELEDMGCTLLGVTRTVKGASIAQRNIAGDYEVSNRKGYVRLECKVLVRDETLWEEVQRKIEDGVDRPVTIYADEDHDKYIYTLYGLFREVKTSFTERMQYTIVLDSLGAVI